MNETIFPIWMGKYRFKICILLLVAFTILFLLNAWFCDDAFISFRQIDNLINGYGLRFNSVERVQAFTNTLWTLINVPFHAILQKIGLPKNSIIVQAWILSYMFDLLFFRVLYSVMGVEKWLIATFLMICSRYFIDFSSSGLETPLTYFLLANLLLLIEDENQPRRLFKFGLVLSLLILNRPDTGILFSLIIGIYLWRERKSNKNFIMSFIPGLFLLVPWTIFSLIYYGQLMPNSVYAKMNLEGVKWIDTLHFSAKYMFVTLTRAPYLSLVISSAALTGLFIRVNKKVSLIWFLLIAHCFFILFIGSDFMIGRFLVPAFILGVYILVQTFASQWKFNKALITAALFFCFLTPNPHYLFYHSMYDKFFMGVTDEKAWYFKKSGLNGYFIPKAREKHYFLHPMRPYNTRRDTAIGNIGAIGYYRGPEFHIIDIIGLSDPFIANMPSQKLIYRAGHMPREIPGWYIDFIHSYCLPGKPLKHNALFNDLILITRSEELFKKERWEAILRYNAMQFGLYDYAKKQKVKS